MNPQSSDGGPPDSRDEKGQRFCCSFPDLDRQWRGEDSGVHEIADSLQVNPDSLLPVRLVSHHMRLLGVLCRKAMPTG
jgi:hypothetical protein